MTEPVFLEAVSRNVIPGRPVIMGCPLDCTSTYRTGSDQAPDAIRVASDSIETYSPLLDGDLLDSPFADLGNFSFSGLSLESALEKIREQVQSAMDRGAIPLLIGGEHTITLPAVTAVRLFHPELVVMHLDAHTDLRDEYDGSHINHATVMRRVAEIVGADHLIQLGIRSGTKEEFAWMREHGTIMEWLPATERNLLKRIKNRPVYLTVDLDVLDPSCMPGTGNPEAGGWSYHEMERLLRVMNSVDLTAADVVELNPSLDLSEVSSITAAKIIRELLLILGRER